MTTPATINPLDQLNPAQRDAVTATEGPLLVIAGAGSGKTRVITHRIAYLVRELGIAPWQIFAATFTNKAAEEMRHRIKGMLPGYETARLTISTFHSICVMILRRECALLGLNQRFTIADDSDQLALIKDCLRELEIPSSHVTPEGVRHWISRAKIIMARADQARDALGWGKVDPKSIPDPKIGPTATEIRESLGSELGEEYTRAYSLYEERLHKNNAVDFDDLLLLAVKLFVENPDVLAAYQDRWRYLLVDEYQDTNRVQYEFIKLLAARSGNICVVGDEDQSIYSWRGAEIENILNFPNEFEGCRIIRLEQNYRSTETILKAAESVIKHNTQRHGKHLFSERGDGEPIGKIVGMDEREEAALVVDTIRRLKEDFGVPYRHVAIFYRVNALSRLFEDFLRQNNINYKVIGGVRFHDRAEIKDLLAYLRLVVNPLDGISLTRIINRPRRGIGDKTLTQIFSGATAAGISLWEQIAISVAGGDLPKKQRASLAGLIGGINAWRKLAEYESPVHVLERILKDTAYEESLGDPSSIDTLSRVENIAELKRALEDFRKNNPNGELGEYLEMVALTAAVDQYDADHDSVSLMSLHSAKGLEFPVVFMTGLEDGIFPSARTVQNGGLEEERRLFYVGVTRAQDKLFLARADSRNLYGRKAYNPPSLFLTEVPSELMLPLDKLLRKWISEAPRPAPREVSARRVDRASGARVMADSQPDASIIELNEPMLFPPGSRIRHSKLGEGEVVAVSGRGQMRKVAIRFDAGLELELLERFGGLERVGELPF